MEVVVLQATAPSLPPECPPSGLSSKALSQPKSSYLVSPWSWGGGGTRGSRLVSPIASFSSLICRRSREDFINLVEGGGSRCAPATCCVGTTGLLSPGGGHSACSAGLSRCRRQACTCGDGGRGHMPTGPVPGPRQRAPPVKWLLLLSMGAFSPRPRTFCR